MNTMTMPGFTADQAVYKTNGHYWRAGGSIGRTASQPGLVQPMQHATPLSGGDVSSTCGGIAGIPCPGPNQYCDFGGIGNCRVPGAQGTCKTRPQICPLFIRKGGYCGCDGKNYGNPCFAAQAATSIAHEGPCDAGKGLTCGGIAGIPCPGPDQYCDFRTGNCRVADAQGTCKTRPEFCYMVVDPVCGCDGNTYTNACYAHQAGVSIDHKGKCSGIHPLH